jgi:hypothetical protein
MNLTVQLLTWRVCALVLEFWDERNRAGGPRGPEPIKCGLAGSFEIAFVSVRGPQVRAFKVIQLLLVGIVN